VKESLEEDTTQKEKEEDTARKENDALTAERAGRVRAERALREMVNKAVTSASGGGYPLLPIGKIRSPFRGRWGTPRQGMLAPHTRAHIELSPAIPAVALQGLTEFSHVFVLFLFHENSSMHKLARVQGPGYQKQQRRGGRIRGPEGVGGVEVISDFDVNSEEMVVEDEDATMARLLRERNFNAFIEAPALKGGRTGALATRSPHRPNAVGLSLCRLIAVHPHTPGSNKANSPMVVLAGSDLLDGTPVVDIKPYAPYDCPTCLGDLIAKQTSENQSKLLQGTTPPSSEYSPPHTLEAAVQSLSAASDINSAESYALRGPSWVYGSLQDQAKARLPVVWKSGTAEFILEAVRAGKTKFYGLREAALHHGGGGDTGGGESEGRALLQALSQVLALDIRAVHHGRGGAPSETRGGASTSNPSLLRRMGLDGGEVVGEGGVVSSSSDVPLPTPEPGVQYYELWFDVFDIKWQCVDAAWGGAESGGVAGIPEKGGKQWYARVDSVSFAQ